MQTKRKANSVVTSRWDEATQTLTYTVLGVGDKTLHMARVHPANKARMMVHGANQRGIDRCAIGRDPKTGRSATPQAKFDRLAAWVDLMNSGADRWDMRVEGPTGPRVDGTIIQGIARMRGTDEAAARVWAQAKADARGVGLAAYLESLHAAQGDVGDRLRTIIAGIRASEAGVDVSGDMDELTGPDEDPDDQDGADTEDTDAE